MNAAPPGTVIFRNGRIYTLDDQSPRLRSLVVHGGRVVASENEARFDPDSARQGEIIDLKGRTVLPGLIDAHIHLEQLARSQTMVDCETADIELCLARIKDRAARTPAGEWVLGHGWNQNLWGRFGSAADLDAVAPNHPVYLTAKSLHAAWVNNRALQLAGLSASTSDPDGGMLQRDPDGSPNGILFEAAMEMVSRFIEPSSALKLADMLKATQEALWRLGLTGVHDFDGPRCFQALQALHERGELGLRVVKHIRHKDFELAAATGLRTGFGDAWIRVGNVKVFADGALGPRTAAMIQAYTGEPENLGVSLIGSDELFEIGVRAVKNGLAMAVHAIGDRANRIVLDAYEGLRRFEADEKLPHYRHRIEHLQLLHPDDLPRPSALGLIASMQPIHATSDMQMADRYWGERVHYSYAWGSLERAGAKLAFGSDAPVESPNPFWGLHAAVTRRRPDGSPNEEGWMPAERLTVSEALRAYTRGPAYAANQEGVQGCLKPGSFADLIILDEDPFACDPALFLALRPVGTMVGGIWRHRLF